MLKEMVICVYFAGFCVIVMYKCVNKCELKNLAFTAAVSYVQVFIIYNKAPERNV